MKRFHITLKTLIANDLRSASEISRVAETTPTTISRICSGSDCTAEVMGKITRAFPTESQRLALLGAWLEDRAEEAGYANDQVRAAFGADLGITIPPHIRGDLLHLLSLPGMSDPNEPLAQLIKQFAAITRPSPVTESEVAEGPGPTNLPTPKVVTYPNASPTPKKPRK